MPTIQAIKATITTISTTAITILIGLIIAKLASKIVKKILAEAEINRILTNAGFKPISDAIALILEYIIYTITLLIALQQLGLTKTVITIIAIIATITIAISLLLTIRDFIPNFVAGLLIRKQLKNKLGKKIKIGTIEGTLTNYGPIASTITDKEEHHIPHVYTSKYLKQSQAD